MLRSVVRNSVLLAVRRRLTTMPLSGIEDVDLDPQGTFKYILINVGCVLLLVFFEIYSICSFLALFYQIQREK